jgi:membrane associated rhomboid family serine protease
LATCYRHPQRETGVSCSNCGNPICPDCMTPTQVGMRCPDCAKQKTQVHTMRSLAVDPIATYVLIAINVAIYFAAGTSSTPPTIEDEFALYRLDIYPDGTLHGLAEGEFWRLVTAGFLHTEWWHIIVNMIALLWLGRLIEPALGHARFLAIYFASLLTGSLGAILLSPDSSTRGASGAIYGLFGAAIVMARNRQIDLMQSGLLPVLGLNLLITFVYRESISVGGHVGGLVGGLLVAFVVEELAKRRRKSTVPAVVFCAVIGLAAAVWSIASVS